MMAAMAAVRRVLHRHTASLYARLPKCGNNAIRLLLFAQWSNLSDSEIQDQWNKHMDDHTMPGVVKVEGMQWDKRQLPPGGSFKPVIVRTLKPPPGSHLATR